jgi:hypothetical protein
MPSARCRVEIVVAPLLVKVHINIQDNDKLRVAAAKQPIGKRCFYEPLALPKGINIYSQFKKNRVTELAKY